MRALRILCFTLLGLAGTGRAAEPVHHDLAVRLDPPQGVLEVEDTLTLPAAGPVDLVLHAGLEPRASGARIEARGASADAPWLTRYRLEPTGGPVVLRYGGPIHHPVSERREGVGRLRDDTPGTIGADGVYLSGSVAWYPLVEGSDRVTFRLAVEVPEGWQAVSQGAREEAAGRVVWRESRPQDDIYLSADRYTLYRRAGDGPEAQVYLRAADPALAERYLAATDRYLALYQRLLGPYPYAKFAAVENFWESGYGMPSFTLLGPKVMRLPFILDSSYPHEILHNWWGNGVYVDYAGGNWAEGLTAYLADHLLKEREGRGEEYRRDQLQKYAEFVKDHGEFPLRRFTARHSDASQAIGYGKGALLFHMLRRHLGDEPFVAALRRFYKEHRFARAGFDDLRRAFEAVGGKDLRGFFGQWVERPGAPALRLDTAEAAQRPDGWELHLGLSQVQDGPAYDLEVPLAIQFGDQPAREEIWPLAGRRGGLVLVLPERPLRVVVDPRFDLFRRLDPAELPVALDRLFGAPRPLLVLPGAAEPDLLQAYRALAGQWGLDSTLDRDLDALPADRVVFVLGWENRLRAPLAALLAPQGAELGADGVRLEGQEYDRAGHCVAATVPRGRAPIAFVGCGAAEAVAGLARKLPHYGKYSYLAFAGPQPDNVLKGQWPVTGSPLERPLVAEELPLLRLAPRAALVAGEGR